MDFKTVFDSRKSFYLLPVVFFWILLPLGLGFPRELKIIDFGLFFFYLISFIGSIIFMYSFREQLSHLIFIIPFVILTASGILFSANNLLNYNTPDNWPLIPVTRMLFILSNLLLAPAIALLLFPFVREMETPPEFFFGCLVSFSLILAVVVFNIVTADIFPILDPEFVWSRFWDFSIGNLWSSTFYALYLIFGMPLTGLLSIFIIHDYLRSRSASDGGC